jgi:hypothetical protein
MKSVGEAMAIGRTFMESLRKCLRSLENPNGTPSLSPGLRGASRTGKPSYPWETVPTD